MKWIQCIPVWSLRCHTFLEGSFYTEGKCPTGPHDITRGLRGDWLILHFSGQGEEGGSPQQCPGTCRLACGYPATGKRRSDVQSSCYSRSAAQLSAAKQRHHLEQDCISQTLCPHLAPNRSFSKTPSREGPHPSEQGSSTCLCSVPGGWLAPPPLGYSWNGRLDNMAWEPPGR